MATVSVPLRTADGRLPEVCMVCGDEATVTKTKKMSWCPPWVGVLILVAWPVWLIVTLIMTKRATVQAPFCEAHRGHWFNRLMILLGSALLCTVIGGGGFFAIFAMAQPGPANDAAGFACLVPVGMFILWIIILVIVQSTAIRPDEITDRDVRLKGVCQEFVDAVEAQEDERRSTSRGRRGRYDDEDDEPPPPKKKRRPVDDENDEPPPPKKKRPPVDAIEEGPPRKKKRPPVDEEEDAPPPPKKKKRPPPDAFEE